MPASPNQIRRFGADGLEKAGGIFPFEFGNALCDVGVDPDGDIWFTDGDTDKVREIDRTTSTLTGAGFGGGDSALGSTCIFSIDSAGNFYVSERSGTFGELPVRKFDPEGNVLYDLDVPGSGFGGIGDIAVDLSNDRVFVSNTTSDTVFVFESNSAVPMFEIESEGEPQGVAVDSVTHDAYIVGTGGVQIWNQGSPTVVPDVTTEPPTPAPTEATLKGVVNPDGVPTTECAFQWGTGGSSNSYPNELPCNEGEVHGGSADIPVTANIAGLAQGNTYHYRFVAKNGSEILQKGKDFEFTAQDLPKVENEFVDGVNTDSAFMNATINPEAGFTSVHVVYGPTAGYGSVAPQPPVELLSNTEVKDVRFQLGGLEPGTTYHYRIVATNLAGATRSSSDQTFRTFDFSPVLDDPCSNALARQQTGAALLLDCRAYELVSAANAGGYNVESDLIPGQTPFAGYPRADSRVLYGMHNGGLSGVGSPTNLGVDPYIATRGANGWSTEYVGIPADGTPSAAPFGSPLGDSSDALGTFAFGGENICDPCFGDGSTGIPVRLASGELVQGMKGSMDPGPAAEPSGYVGKAVSRDGSHLIFGSTSQFEPAGNNGSLTIYDRNLSTGTTQVASTMPGGSTMTRHRRGARRLG